MSHGNVGPVLTVAHVKALEMGIAYRELPSEMTVELGKASKQPAVTRQFDCLLVKLFPAALLPVCPPTPQPLGPSTVSLPSPCCVVICGVCG
jgi:hypothetical protein